ncbi:MAG TPA: PAS domain S-box protein, partial [Opitutaceae bacterium]|nr:PAS domain S-box protein [Opitutaceae bacterium]
MVDRSLNLRQYVWVYAPLLIVGAIGAGAALGGQDDPSSLRHTAVDIAMILLEAVLAGYFWTLRGRLDGNLPRWLSLCFALAAVMATVDFSSAGAWDRTLGEDFESSRVWLGWSWTFAGLVLPFALGAALWLARRDGHLVRKKEVIAMVVGVMVLLVIALKLRVALLGSAGALSENVIAAVIWLGLGIISWRQKASYRIAPALAGYAGAQALAHLTALFASTEDPHALAAHFGKICSEIILLVALIQLATREQTRGVVLRQVQDELHAGARELGVVRDRLRMGEARLAGIVDSAMDPIISVNAEQRIVLFNVAAERVFRCSASDALNQDLSKFIPMRYQEAHRRHVQGFGKTGDTSRSMRSLGELLGRRADGEEFPIEASISQIEIDGQKIFTVILRDITERKRAEIVLREKERQLHATDRRLAEIVQGMTEACFAVDTDWKFTFVNDRSATLLKRTREQMLGHSLWEIFPHLVGAAPEKHYRQVMHERSAQSFEILSPIAGRWLEVRLFPTSEGVAAFLLDISERKAAEESVRLSEWKFAQAFANNPAAIALVRMEDGVVLDVNDTWLSLCGYTRVEILHHSVRDLWPDPAEAARFVEELREKGVVRGREQTFRKKSGELFVTEFSSQVLTFNGDAVILSTFIDVTEKKRVEATFRRQEALLRETGHIAKVGGWEFDVRTGEGSWTEEVARIHGLDPKTVTSVSVGLSYYQGESLRRIQSAIQIAIAEGKAYDLELELTTGDGAHKWVRTIGHPITEGGQVVVVRGSFQDITDRKRAEAALQESEQQFRQVVEAINEVFWITDVEKRRILYVSPAYEVIWGRTCESLYQDPSAWAQAIHPEDRDGVMARVKERQRLGTYNEVFRIIRPDQSERWIHDRAFPVRNEDGEVYRVVGTAADVTEKKRGELRAAVHHAVIRVLSEGAPLHESMRRLLEIICRQFNWEFADLWAVDKAAKLLRCVEMWHSPTETMQSFAEATRSLSFVRGQGLPGRVWEGNCPVHFPDLQNDSRFLRRTEASTVGLKSGLAFPIVMRREVYGVFEFFGRRPMPLDDDLLALLTLVGTQIGEFIERKQLEDKFRQAQKMEAIGTLAAGVA